MELRQIKYFIEVARREHITGASQDLHVAQSAVSRQILNLELELGVKLFIREGRNVRLTPVGRLFLKRMEQAMQVIEKAQREIEESLDPRQGTIRIGFPSSMAAYVLPTVVSEFREMYPNVKFQLRQGSYRHLIETVIHGEIDLALLGPVPESEKRVIGYTLFHENITALLPSRHPFSDRQSLRLSQLRNESFVLFPKGFILREIVESACKEAGFVPEVSFEGEDIDAIKGLVAAGLGVSLIPEITLVDNLPRSTLKVPLTNPSLTRSVGVIVPADRELLPTEKIFFQFLRDYFSGSQGLLFNNQEKQRLM